MDTIEDKGAAQFSIKEFAKVCGTTRDTLYHYEDQKLLIPQVKAQNRYRYYSARDFFRFQYIAHLRRLGFTVRQIRSCVTGRNLKKYIENLEISQEACLQKIKKLQEQYQTCALLKKDAVGALALQHCSPRLEYCGEEYFFASPFCGDFQSLDGLSQIYSHTNCAESALIPRRNVLIYRVAQKDILGKIFRHCAVMSRVDDCALFPDEKVHIKPAGTYLHFYFGCDLVNSDEKSRTACFEKFMNYVHEHNFSVCSDLYCSDIVGPFLTDQPDQMLIEFALRVE